MPTTNDVPESRDDRDAIPGIGDVYPSGPGAAERARLAPDGLPVPRRYWSVLAIWLAMSMTVIDSSIANIALPAIARDLGASAAASVWVVNAYQIAIAMLILPVAALGERFSYRRVYMVGLCLFIAASLACALAHNLTQLAIARFFQGFGAASVMGVNGALVRFTYPRAMLGRGVGYNALVVASMSAAGPSIAAAILAVAQWQWLFAINVPLGLLSLLIGFRCLPRTAAAETKLDAVSAVLNAVAFALFFLSTAELARGIRSPTAFAELAAGLVVAVLLIRRERGEARPLVPIDLLRIPILRLSYAASSCAFAGAMIAMVSIPFYFQMRLGFDHVETGLLITPFPLSIAVAAPIAGRLVDRFPAGLLGGCGLLVSAAGFALLAVAPAHQPTLYIVPSMMLCGAGFGFFQTPNNRTMLGVAPADRAGAAGGMLAMARLFGQTSGGVAVAFLFHLVGAGSNLPLVVGSVLALVAAIFSFRRLRV